MSKDLIIDELATVAALFEGAPIAAICNRAITALQQSKPEEWKCFQCGEVFTDKDKAAEHFGHYQHQQPACTIDVAEYRRMEELHRQYLNEETEKDRAMYSMRAEHATALRRAEEEGYNKGITENIECLSVALRNEAANMVKEDGGYTKAERETIHKSDGLEVAADIIEAIQQSKPVVPDIEKAIRDGLAREFWGRGYKVVTDEMALGLTVRVYDDNEGTPIEEASKEIARDLLSNTPKLDDEPLWGVFLKSGSPAVITRNEEYADGCVRACDLHFPADAPHVKSRLWREKE